MPGGVLFIVLFLFLLIYACLAYSMLAVHGNENESVLDFFSSMCEPCADIKCGSTRTSIYHHLTSVSNGQGLRFSSHAMQYGHSTVVFFIKRPEINSQP